MATIDAWDQEDQTPRKSASSDTPSYAPESPSPVIPVQDIQRERPSDAPPEWRDPGTPPAYLTDPNWTPNNDPGQLPEWPSWMDSYAPQWQLPEIPNIQIPTFTDPTKRAALPPMGSQQGPGYQDLNFWKTQGVNETDIYDPATGQLKNGWFRTQNGYDTTQGPGAAKIRDAYKNAIGREATDDEVIGWLSGKNGWGSGEAGVDKIVGAIYQQGGKTAPTTTGTTTTTTTTAPNLPPGMGANPTPTDWEKWFMTATAGKPITSALLASMEPELAKYGIKLQKDSAGNIRGRIFLPDGRAVDVVNGGFGGSAVWMDRGYGSKLVEGGGVATPGAQYSDAYTKLLEQLMQARIGALQQPVNDPYKQQYEAALQARAKAMGEAEPQYQQLMDYLQKRFESLQGPGYTGAENEVLRTQALDPIEQDRAAAKKRVVEQMAAHGHTMESGPMQQALQMVDAQFDAMRAQNQTSLASQDIARREDRQSRAQGIAANLVDIPQARANQQLDIFQALSQLADQVRSEEDARQREAISYGGALSDLGPQRLQLAMQAAGMGGSPDSMFSNLMNLANLNQRSTGLNNSQNTSFWSGLGSIAAILANAGQR